MKKWDSNDCQGRTNENVESSYVVAYIALWFTAISVLALILT